MRYTIIAILQKRVGPFVWLLWLPPIFKAKEYPGVVRQVEITSWLLTSKKMELTLSSQRLLFLSLVKIQNRDDRRRLQSITSHPSPALSHSMHSKRPWPSEIQEHNSCYEYLRVPWCMSSMIVVAADTSSCWYICTCIHIEVEPFVLCLNANKHWSLNILFCVLVFIMRKSLQ